MAYLHDSSSGSFGKLQSSEGLIKGWRFCLLDSSVMRLLAGCHCSLPNGPLHSYLSVFRTWQLSSSEREIQKEEIREFLKSGHQFSFILFVGSEPLSPAHTQRERGIRFHLLKGGI